jgi:hypothetical protein
MMGGNNKYTNLNLDPFYEFYKHNLFYAATRIFRK